MSEAVNSPAVSPALIVVHGIGTQLPGATLRQAASGLMAVCPKASLIDSSGAVIQLQDIETLKLRQVQIRQGPLTMRLFEAYWADLLPNEAVKNTFDPFYFEETTWFPLFNWRAGLLPRDQYPGWLVAARTTQLWLLQLAATVGIEPLTRSRWAQSLDRTAADVWHYVHSLGGEVAAGSPLAGAGEQILDRLHHTWMDASADGPVHLMGHSLGSVVAYHAVTRRLPPQSIARLITVGSPLEKVRFLWSKLFPPVGEWTCDWTNYLSPSDPVSGSLKRFTIDPQRPVRNVRLWGLGGYGQAHIGYFRDPRVARDVANGLGATIDGTVRPSGSSWLGRRTWDVAVPLGAAAIVTLGAALLAVFFATVVWLTALMMGSMVGLVSASAGAAIKSGWLTAGTVLAPILWLHFVTRDGYRRAATRHKRRWCG
jgi:hypothetical protein